jgi:16S rRNA (guanine966-N2)-methyltransferase
MRIIHGKYRSRRLNLPKNLKARPTTDQARESLFNILINRLYFEDIKVIDLFSGTGSISFEFASLGTRDITLVEKNRFNIQTITKNIELLGIDCIQAISGDVFTFISRNRVKYDLIFADPPYDLPAMENLPDLLIPHLSEPEGCLILEHGPSHRFNDHPNFQETRQYGKVHFSFFGF